MKRFFAGLGLVAFALHASAGELRVAAGAGVGGLLMRGHYGDELELDTSSSFIGGTFYADESGPFIGLDLERQTLGKAVLNGVPQGNLNVDQDVTAITLGYRTGMYGAPQFLVSGSLRRMVADGESATGQSIFLGLERAEENGRITLGVSYSGMEDARALGVSGAGIYYLNDYLGVGAGLGYAAGSEKVSGANIDTYGWHAGLVLELRWRPGEDRLGEAPRLKEAEVASNPDSLVTGRPSTAGQSEPVGDAPVSSGTSAIEERMRSLERLHRNGLVSDAEYEAKRKAILSDL